MTQFNDFIRLITQTLLVTVHFSAHWIILPITTVTKTMTTTYLLLISINYTL